MNIASFGDYVSALFDSGSAGSYVSLGILGYFLITVFFGLILGLRRGIGKQLVRLLTTVLAVAASFILMSYVSVYINSLFAGRTLEEVIISVYPTYNSAVGAEVRDLIASFDAESARVLILVPVSAVIVPMVFALIFALVNTVSWILYWIIHSIFGLTGYKKGVPSALLGGLLGLLQGVLVAALVLVPVAGISGVVMEAKDTVLANEGISEDLKSATVEYYDLYAREVVENPLFGVINSFGGETIYSHFSTIKIGEDMVDTRDTLINLVDIGASASAARGMDFTAPDGDAQKIIRSVISEIGADKCLATVVSGAVRGIATATEDGALVVSVGEPYNALVMALIDAFTHTDTETVDDDLGTLCNVYFILCDSGFISAIGGEDSSSNGISDMLVEKDGEGKTVIDRVIGELKNNPHTCGVVDALSKLSVALLCESLGLDEDATELYESVTNDVKDVLAINKDDYATEDEYKADVALKLDEALKSNDIVLESEIVDEMANYVAENFGDRDDITDADVSDAILSYYNAYLKYLETGNAEDLPEIE